MLPTGQACRDVQNLERAPEIIPLSEEDEIEQKGFKGRLPLRHGGGTVVR
jgi:hypothetical protein